MTLKTFPNTPDVPFVEGTVYTPDLAYQSFYSPVFDDQPEYLGHRDKIYDVELSDDPAAIKSRFRQVEDGLRVTVEAGLTLRYATGSVRLPDGSVLSISTGLVTAPNNATSFIYLDQAGTVVCAASAPVLRTLLARVVTVSGVVTTLQDLRHPSQRMVSPIASAIKVFGGVNTTDKVCTAAEVFDQGLYYYRNFTVPPGITITIDKFARFFCSGRVSIQGTINVTYATAGGGAFGTGAVSTIALGGYAGSGIGAGSGSGSGGSGASYPFAMQPFGSGGGLGFGSGSSGSFQLAPGGRGGGGLWFEATGDISINGATINLDGETGFASPFAIGPVLVSGSGGGSGGTIILSSLTAITVSATSNVLLRGGDGGQGVGSGAAGGSGGGGGQFVAMAPSVNYSGANIAIGGGAQGYTIGSPLIGGGGGAGNGGAGGNQSAGSAGRIIQRLFVPIGN